MTPERLALLDEADKAALLVLYLRSVGQGRRGEPNDDDIRAANVTRCRILRRDKPQNCRCEREAPEDFKLPPDNHVK